MNNIVHIFITAWVRAMNHECNLHSIIMVLAGMCLVLYCLFIFFVSSINTLQNSTEICPCFIMSEIKLVNRHSQSSIKKMLMSHVTFHISLTSVLLKSRLTFPADGTYDLKHLTMKHFTNEIKFLLFCWSFLYFLYKGIKTQIIH